MTATATAANGTPGRKITVSHEDAALTVTGKNAAWAAVGTDNPYHPSGLSVRLSKSEDAIRKLAAEEGLTVVAVQDPS